MRFLDVLRGVAILGILPVNAEVFAYPMMLSTVRTFPAGGGLLDEVAHAAVQAVFRYKFITLFAFLFGVGIGIMHTRVSDRGGSYGGVMGRRLGVLWVFGVLHATLLWWGDIVSYYAPIGLALCWLAALDRKALGAIGATLIGLPALCLCGIGMLAAAATAGAGGEFLSSGGPVVEAAGRELATGAWRDFGQAAFEHRPGFELAVYAEGSFLRITALRTLTWIGMMPVALVYFGPRLAGLMLLGSACAKSGWFMEPGSEEGRRWFRRLLAGGLAVGLLFTGPAVATYATDSPTPQLQALWEGFNYVGSLGLSAAYLAVVALATARRPGAWWTVPFAAVGRTAFSNYIGQSVVMTGLFYSYGAAWYARVGRAELFGIVAAVWTVQLILSPLWLHFFRLGPIEWLWRSATYGRLQPLRR